MARTRDRRPSADVDEHHFIGGYNDSNGPDNHRVYEESELNAAEALMGINASPTTSHANEPMSASTVSRFSPPYQIPQRLEDISERHRRHKHLSITPRSTGRRQSRGKSTGNVSAPSEETADGESKLVPDRDDLDSIHGEGFLADQQSLTNAGYSGPDTSTSFLPSTSNDSADGQQGDGSYYFEHTEEKTTSAKSSRKRKRGDSASVAAISRSRVGGLDDLLNGEHGMRNGILDGHARTASEPETTPQTNGMNITEQQPKHDVGGLAYPEVEKTANGTKGRKTKSKNFDQVVFGNWLIKTWYYSPYPIPSAEEDNTSVSTGPSKQSSVLSATRPQHSKRSGARSRQQSSNTEDEQHESTTLWVCDRCFKYMQDGSLFGLHSRSCDRQHPPGRVVYQRGAHIMYEIDGAKDKLYCQNLSLFGKFFIDIKTLFFDCENFMFYVLTEGDRHRDHVLGFFSKEKVSYDDYNLACIITFPPYQRMRFGMLMIEFSYELSRRAGKLGTPERPLSELGLRTYLTYWTGALVQFFRRVLSIQPFSDIARDQQRPIDDDLIRFIEARDTNSPKKRRRNGRAIGDNSYKARIWESGLENQYNTGDVIATTSGANDILYSQMRWMRTTVNPDGSVTTHVFARCTLEDIANATGIRTEDVAFTLHECGLLQRIQSLDREETEGVIVISREMVEQVAQEFKVKSKMCMEVQYCKF